MRQANYRKPSANIRRVEPLLRPSDAEIDSLAALLNEAEAVTILAGLLNYMGVNPKIDCTMPQPST